MKSQSFCYLFTLSSIACVCTANHKLKQIYVLLILCTELPLQWPEERKLNRMVAPAGNKYRVFWRCKNCWRCYRSTNEEF